MTEADIEHWAFEHYDPRDGETLHDPYPIYKAMRDKCPVAHSDRYEDGFWVVSRHEDVKAILDNAPRFNSGPSEAIPAFGRKLYPVEANGERHLVLRRIASRNLDLATVSKMEERIRPQITELIDQLVARGECDLVEDFAVPVPSLVLFHPPLLGHPLPIDGVDDWVATFRDWVIDFKFDASKTEEAGRLINAYLSDMMENRRKNPQDDMPSALMKEVEAGVITQDEALTMFFTVLFGGIDTPASAIAAHMLHLAEHPEMRAMLQADHDLIPSAIEELIRFYGPSQGVRRTATEDVCVHGRQIKSGDPVLVLVNSANRDGRVFEDPDTIKYDRRPNRHIGFGSGAHRCIGSHLARLMMRIVWEEMITRAPPFRVKEGAKLDYLHSTGRSLRSLPIVFEK